MSRFLQRLKNAFSFDRMACRLILSWCCFIITSLGEKDAFTKLSWMQDTELSEVALTILICFAAFSLVSILIQKINTDALFLLFGSTFCIAFWCIFAPNTNREWFMISAIVVYSLFLVYCIRALSNVWNYVKMHTPVAIILATLAGLVCFGGIALSRLSD